MVLTSVPLYDDLVEYYDSLRLESEVAGIRVFCRAGVHENLQCCALQAVSEQVNQFSVGLLQGGVSLKLIFQVVA